MLPFSGVFLSTAANCIIYYNTSRLLGDPTADGTFLWLSNVSYTCIANEYLGGTTITNDPEVLDGIHLSATSPCRGAGSPTFGRGTDIDGQPWANPPSMGCDEFYEADCTGPLSVSASPEIPTVVQQANLRLLGAVTGRAARLEWDFGDGGTITNLSLLTVLHAWTNPGDYKVTFTAFNLDSPGGVSTSCIVHILPLVSPALSGPEFDGTNYSFSFVTQPGASYVVEQTTNLSAPAIWQTVGYISGTGLPVQAIDRTPRDAARFYRVRIK